MLGGFKLVHTVRQIWRGGKCIHTINGHTDAVRGLCLVPGLGFASCSNDTTVRLWTADGQPIAELNGHTNFVYSVCWLAPDLLVSCGEDKYDWARAMDQYSYRWRLTCWLLLKT